MEIDAGTLAIIAIVALGIAAAIVRSRHLFYVFEYERGLLYRYGKLVEIIDAGKHERWGSGYELTRIDMRQQVRTVGTQEILAADGLTIKLSATMRFQVADPQQAVHASESYNEAAYLIVQLAIREAMTGLTADEVIERRSTISEAVTEACKPQFAALELSLERAEVRDIVFPGELKKAFAQITIAQKEGQAALERARSEMAALRSLANAAKMLENNPALAQLRMIQALGEGKGGTLVLNTGDGILPLTRE